MMAVIVCVDYQYHITMKPMVVRLIKEDIDSVLVLTLVEILGEVLAVLSSLDSRIFAAARVI